LAEAQHHQRELREAIISRANRTCRNLELGAITLFIGLGACGVVDFFTGWLTGSKFWSAVVAIAALWGTYQLIMDTLQRPKLGMRTVLNGLARLLLAREIRRVRASSLLSVEDVVIKDGRISMRERQLS
jgi:hypothetical protein